MLRDDVKSNVVTDFLPLVDNFELAGKQLKLETEGEKKVDSAYQVNAACKEASLTIPLAQQYPARDPDEVEMCITETRAE